MGRDSNTAKTIVTAGTAAALCGALLYAVGQTLSFLFRDVDPARIEKKAAEELDAEEKDE